MNESKKKALNQMAGYFILMVCTGMLGLLFFTAILSPEKMKEIILESIDECLP